MNKSSIPEMLQSLDMRNLARKGRLGLLQIILLWLAGFAVSFLAICAICYIFHDSADPSDWNEELRKLLPSKGTVIRHRSEGWADSYVGAYGICGISDFEKYDCPKVLIWGDSYVQGLQIADKDKMSQVFTEMWNSSRGDKTELLGISVAFGGTNAADYYFMMPYYQKKAGNPICNFIFLHSFADVSADVPGISNAIFSSTPEFSLEFKYSEPVIWKQDLLKIMNKVGMDFIWYLYKDLGSYELNFRLETFDQKRNRPKINKESKDFVIRKPSPKTVESWDFMLKKLKEVSTAPIVFVYCPEMPSVKKGRILNEDQNKESLPEFKRICDINGIGLVDMTEDFRAFYEKTGAFPRGFQNSYPYGGHINRNGHRLTAIAIYNYMKDHINALHTD